MTKLESMAKNKKNKIFSNPSGPDQARIDG